MYQIDDKEFPEEFRALGLALLRWNAPDGKWYYCAFYPEWGRQAATIPRDEIKYVIQDLQMGDRPRPMVIG